MNRTAEKIPILLAAFGTTSKALATYSFIDDIVKKRFPDHEVLWSYSSRMVKDRIKKKRNIELKHPCRVLAELKAQGFAWAAVQSLHLMCGHEFYRLVDEAKECDIRTSIGLPLLYSPIDYKKVLAALDYLIPFGKEDAVVFIGHGTDHSAWATYAALLNMLRESGKSNAYVGVVEQGHASMEEVVRAVRRAGYKHVLLVPLMLVAGVHFMEDMAGDEESWKTAFEAKNISVSLEQKGLGLSNSIIEIFRQHIHDALDVIPSGE
ncbi:MAG: sirohydrochlorin cobaltochelatase [Desulfosarcina sp.]|nr:sirohydrochlorin cobaltochelatase [Desulfobacterales bacterium]